MSAAHFFFSHELHELHELHEFSLIYVLTFTFLSTHKLVKIRVIRG
jgi:hypothetical protein